MQLSHRAPPFRPAALLGWLVLVFAFAGLGAAGSSDAPTFYAQLAKPAWAPPAWVFGPVWTVLYLLMAVAIWQVWREAAHPGRSRAVALFLVQIVANALWSWLFFAWHTGLGAMVDVVLMWGLIVATMTAFRRIRPTAAWLMAPYLAWVSFAAFLTWTVWQANPQLL
jgi:tryptophan-rich sensory protein